MGKEKTLTFNSFFIISLAVHIVFILLSYRQIQNKPKELILEVNLINLAKKGDASKIGTATIFSKKMVAVPIFEQSIENKKVEEENKRYVEESSGGERGEGVAGVEGVEGESNAQIDNQFLMEYLLLVQQKIESQKSYPEKALERKEEGTTHIKFTILSNGNAIDIKIILSSGFPDLDRAAISMVKNASPFPAPPQNFRLTVKLPITFKIIPKGLSSKGD